MQRAAVIVLCCLAFSANAWGGDDDLKISGVIVDAVTTEPLIGTSVMVQGTNQGGISDLDGRFDLTLPKGSVILVSCIGYEDQTLTIVAENSNLHIAHTYTDESPWGWYLPSTSPTVRADFL